MVLRRCCYALHAVQYLKDLGALTIGGGNSCQKLLLVIPTALPLHYYSTANSKAAKWLVTFSCDWVAMLTHLLSDE